LAGVRGGLGAVVDTEFGHDGADVVADGSGADVQAGGDVGVAVAGGQECEYFAFAAAQLVCVGEDVGAAAAAGWAALPTACRSSILLNIVVRQAV
jgi:hypothetical protein